LLRTGTSDRRWSAADAASYCWPTSSGIVASAPATVRVMVEPLSARRPPVGSWAMTVPAV